MINRSEHILVGTVTSLSDGLTDELVPFTEVELAVEASLKGDSGPVYRFRQFGLMDPSKTDDSVLTVFHPPSLPHWQLGEEVVVFLQKPAHLTGFQPTVGLEQGKLRRVNGRIEQDSKTWSLLEGVAIDEALQLSDSQRSLLQQPTDGVNADDFLDLLSTAVTEQWVKRGLMTNAN